MNLTLSRDERKLFTIPRKMTQGEGAYHLYEYDIESGEKKDIGDLSSVLKRSSPTGNGVMDEKGFMYISFDKVGTGATGNRHAGIVQVDVSDRVQPTVNPPVFEPYGGEFSVAVKITLTTTTAGATVRYTIDGSNPTAASFLYTKPFTLTKSAIIKARAFRNGLVESPTASATFIKDKLLPNSAN